MRSILFIGCLLLSFSAKCQYNFYFGNLHAHSAYSDGNKDSITTGYKTPGEDFYYAKGSYHMDFLGIAEHNHYSSTNNPGNHVADYTKGLFEADTANNEGIFVAMYGMEWGVISNGGHVLAYGVPALVGWESGSGAWGTTNNYDIFCAKSDYTNFWSIINSYPTAFCTLAHPQSGDYGDLLGTASYSSAADNAIAGTAIRSGGAFSTTTDYSDVAATLYESKYFAGLAKGYHLGPAIDHDNHYTTFGRTCHGRTVVLANSLKRDSIMKAYRAMRFYASDDWNAEVNFTVNGNYMGSNFTTPSNSSIAVSINDISNNTGGADPINKIEVYYGVPGSGTAATILTSNTGTNTLNFTHTTASTNQFYYFVKITQTDGDIIWTSPIWILRNSVILPVELTRFSGKQNQHQIDVYWTTAQEINANNFEVERSFDGVNFDKIGTIQSRLHNSSTPTDYSFTDLNAKNGLNFYRLKQVDMNGNFTFSSIIAIDLNKPFITNIRVNPNPVITKAVIFFSAEKETAITLKIYTSEGREVKSMISHLNKGENKLSIDATTLASGVYFIVLSQPDQRIAETRFIRQ